MQGIGIQMAGLGESIERLNQLDAEEKKKLASSTFAELDEEARQEIIEDYMPKNDNARTALLIVLMVGLFAIAGVCVWGGISAKADAAAAAPLYLIATAVVSGTLGLFAKSPMTKAG